MRAFKMAPVVETLASGNPPTFDTVKRLLDALAPAQLVDIFTQIKVTAKRTT